MIKNLIILISIFCYSCQNKVKEELLISDGVKYSIQHPKNWDFLNYGFDGDTYEEPHLEASATLTYGKLLDAKIAMYFIEKLGGKCVLKGILAHTYQELDKTLTKEMRTKALRQFFNQWENDDKKAEFARIYFSASDKECILFELYSKEDQKQKHTFENFYKIIISFHKIDD